MAAPTRTYPYFSYSRIQTFRKCPKAFEFTYVLELPEEFSTIEKHLGTAVHAVFEWAYGERAAGRQPTDDDVRTRFRTAWDGLDIAAARIIKAGMSADDYFRLGAEMAVNFHAHSIRPDTSVTLHLEHECDLALPSGAHYRGVIDRVSRQSSGAIRLTDYKTGRQVPDPRLDLQLRSYALFMFAAHGDSEVEICYEDVRNARALLHSVNRNRAPEIAAELQQAIAAIEKTSEFFAMPSNLCAWCGHQPRCPAGQPQAKANKAAAGEPCPRCGNGTIRAKNGRRGPFLSCSAYPECKFSCDP
jgi:putative RecB family exonuclease